jgi:hypothetical protein
MRTYETDGLESIFRGELVYYCECECSAFRSDQTFDFTPNAFTLDLDPCRGDPLARIVLVAENCENFASNRRDVYDAKKFVDGEISL